MSRVSRSNFIASVIGLLALLPPVNFTSARLFIFAMNDSSAALSELLKSFSVISGTSSSCIDESAVSILSMSLIALPLYSLSNSRTVVTACAAASACVFHAFCTLIFCCISMTVKSIGSATVEYARIGLTKSSSAILPKSFVLTSF